jgi:ribonucleoside-diphosphate reductase alpha chain
MNDIGPQLPFSDQLHADKYRGEGESFKEGCNRIASATTHDQDHFHAFRDSLLYQRSLLGGRIQAAMGSTKAVTAHNCFVSGTIEDSFIDGNGSIMARATEAAQTMRMGGGIGYDFSSLRPKGALIRKLQSKSSGAVSFMDIFDSVCRCIASSGHRRGAQMGVLRVDHPDIEEFIHAKQNNDRLNGFNISVAVTDEFMQAVKADGLFKLRWGGQVYKEIMARPLWEMLMRSAWDWAEPGILFIDTINHMNNLYWCETIKATNPCGEQPLPDYGACLLSSLNLTKFVWGGAFNEDLFIKDIYLLQQALDTVIDRSTYPLFEQEKEAKNKRRMGIGVTGAANAIEALLGYASYGDDEYLDWQDNILATLNRHAYLSSTQLAEKFGAFPMFNRDKFLAGKFVGTLDDDVRDAIAKHGMRNSHLTSIAPTGTISMTADNVSSGIEPVFAYEQERAIQTFDGPQVHKLPDYGVRVFGVYGRTCDDVTIKQHTDVLTHAARHVDSAVSKTCNVPATTSWEDFKQVYINAWEQGAKGCTTYQVGGKRGAVLTKAVPVEDDSPEDEPQSACYVDPVSGRRECE